MGKKVSGLALVGAAGFDPVVGADRDIQFLFQISIEVSEEQAEGSVLVLKPSFVSARYALPGIVRRAGQQLLRGQPPQACRNDDR